MKKNLSPDSGLLADQREILAFLLQEEGIELSGLEPIRPRGKNNELPLSFAQQRLWFLNQLDPASAVYNIPCSVRLKGKLSTQALELTLNEIIRRHEVLRSTFPTVAGKPLQLIHPAQPQKLAVMELSELPEAEREAAVMRIVNKEARRPFDLAQAPLLRAKLLKLAEEDQVLVLVMHHIVSDGWSMGVLIQEMASLYEAYKEGRESALEELPIQYADFAIWQREWLTGEVLDKQISYWKQQLAGAVEILKIPTDRFRPPIRKMLGATQTLELGGELSQQLKELGQREEATPFMVLLAAFSILLHRYSGQEDITVGTPIANRNRIEIERLIGFFVNTLVERIDLRGNPSYRELLRKVREVTLGSYAHQDLPFEKLVDELRPDRDMSHTPLFQIMFAVQNTPQRTLEVRGLKFEMLQIESGTTKFDMTMVLLEGEAGITANLTFATDLFESETISRMLRHYRILLEGIVANPDERIWALPLISELEKQKLADEWNCADHEYTPRECLHELFEAQAEKDPSNVALVFEGEQLTYGDLNRRANQLAHYLRDLGVGPEVLVGICVERSLEMVVGLLGILKAGGAYIPLDPNYPRERLLFMLEDARTPVLVTQKDLVDKLPREGIKLVCLDAEWELIAQQSEENLEYFVSAGSPAYVIYTSGSTGKPKGVLVSHSNVARLFEATEAWFGFNESDVWTLFHSYGFDFSVWELWGALIYGGRLVVVPYWKARLPEAFYDLLIAEGVTVLNQTPSAFRQLIAAEEAAATRKGLKLRLVIFGGEALEVNSLKPWFDRHGDECPQLINMYGITETTVHVTYRRLTAADVNEPLGSVIGRCIPDLQLYILDEYLQPVPIGVAGEMYVGGAGLSRGYLDGPELSAERFIPNPFSSRPGARLYKSGDLGRYLSNGDIEYLRRIDHQVKVRGFRIELGEIESALGEHPGVREAVVIAREDTPGEKRLVAYVVTKPDEAVTMGQLHNFLKLKLPDYMVPPALIELEKLPLTPHGKIDRHALPKPGPARPELENAYVAPQTLFEEALASIWSQVLGLEDVGIHDNFFSVGGDSIRTIQVMAVAKERGLTFSLPQLFQHQTIFELARAVQANEDSPAGSVRTEPFILLSEEDRLKVPDYVEDAYPLTMLQAGMIYHMDLTPDSPVYHNINSIHLRMQIDIAAFQEAVQHVVARHPVLRTSFDMTTYSEPLQLVHKTASSSVVVEDLRLLSVQEQEEAVDAFIESEKKRRFDMSYPPLLGFHIFRRTDETLQFTTTECHAILDGWSLNATLAEIFNYYLALQENESPPEQPLPSVLFRDYVLLERTALESEECRSFWDQKLNGCPVMKLPRWPSALRSISGPRIRILRVPVPTEVSEGLRRLARSAAVPLKSVLLAAHVKAMSLISGQAEIVTGLSTNGRPEEIDGHRVRGLFLNTLPFRLTLPECSWPDLVRKIFGAELELMPYRRFPLATLQKNRNNQPLFETLFNYVHFHVLDDVYRANKVEVLDSGHRRSEETNFTLLTGFGLWTFSRDINLRLHWSTSELCEEQVKAFADSYSRTLAAMAFDPPGLHTDLNTMEMLSEQERMILEQPTEIEELNERFSL